MDMQLCLKMFDLSCLFTAWTTDIPYSLWSHKTGEFKSTGGGNMNSALSHQSFSTKYLEIKK